MVQSGALRLEETKKKVLGVFSSSESMLHQGTPLALQSPEIERAIYEGAKVPVSNARMFYTAANSAAEEIQSRLVGLERGRPVAFLFVACAVTMALAIVVLVARSRRTATGKALLQDYTKKYEARRGDLTTDPASLAASEMSMVVGLWGVSLLSVGPLAPLYRAMPRESGGGGCGGGGCGGGGGGGGCGGGGCGGGGCGGGGCGGCGGG
jgi:hypothetical protein